MAPTGLRGESLSTSVSSVSPPVMSMPDIFSCQSWTMHRPHDYYDLTSSKGQISELTSLKDHNKTILARFDLF